MSVKEAFDHLKKTFTVRKSVDFSDIGIHIELEAPTALEEAKIMEACKDLDNMLYLDGLKKHSLAFAIKRIKTKDADIELSNDMEVEVVDEDGKKETMTKYCFTLRQVEEWPSALRDILFDALTDLQMELEGKIRERVKFERYRISEVTGEEQSEKPVFRKVEEKNEDETEADRLKRHVEKEIDEANTRSFQKEQEALRKYRGF